MLKCQKVKRCLSKKDEGMSKRHRDPMKTQESNGQSWNNLSKIIIGKMVLDYNPKSKISTSPD